MSLEGPELPQEPPEKTDSRPSGNKPGRRGLAADISRELRAPLTVLLGYLEWLQPQAKKDQALVVERMIGQARQMQATLDNLLELSSLREDRYAAARNIVDVPAILTQLKEKAEDLSGGDHFLNFQLDKDLRLLGSVRSIEGAARHLIVNALTFTPPGGSIEVNWQRVPDGAELSVRDSGIGIAQEDIPRLTERFFRASAGNPQGSGGTGLGLAIVRQVLESHQATLSVQSVIGKGSWFCCRFPADRLAPAAGNNEESIAT